MLTSICHVIMEYKSEWMPWHNGVKIKGKFVATQMHIQQVSEWVSGVKG